MACSNRSSGRLLDLQWSDHSRVFVPRQGPSHCKVDSRSRPSMKPRFLGSWFHASMNLELELPLTFPRWSRFLRDVPMLAMQECHRRRISSGSLLERRGNRPVLGCGGAKLELHQDSCKRGYSEGSCPRQGILANLP